MPEDLLSTTYLALPLGVWGRMVLMAIMFTMGLSLTLDDFKAIVRRPAGVLTGLTLQLVVLPLVGFGLAAGMAPSSVVAVSLVVLCVSPGGPPSNLLTFIARGDVALSVSLTATSSLLTVVTIPFIVNLALRTFMGAEVALTLPVLPTMLQVFVLTGIPMLLGMVVFRFAPAWARRAQRPLSQLGLLVLVGIFAMFCHAMWPALPEMIESAGPLSVVLHALTLLVGYYGARLMRLGPAQCRTIAIEVGLQNCLLGFVIAFSLLRQPGLAVVPLVYLVVMNVGLLGYVLYAHFAFRGESAIGDAAEPVTSNARS